MTDFTRSNPLLQRPLLVPGLQIGIFIFLIVVPQAKLMIILSIAKDPEAGTGVEAGAGVEAGTGVEARVQAGAVTGAGTETGVEADIEVPERFHTIR